MCSCRKEVLLRKMQEQLTNLKEQAQQAGKTTPDYCRTIIDRMAA